MKLNQFAFLRAFGRRFSSQIEPPTKCFFNFMDKLQWKQWYHEERIKRRSTVLKDIPGYEGLYAITEDGKVWSYRGKGKFLIPVNNRGYKSVSLYKNGKKSIKRIHRIFATEFLPNPNKKPFINHKNGIRSDNRIDNLEWVTCQENILHGWRSNGREITSKHLRSCINTGKNNSKSIAKIKNGEIIEIYASATEASKKNGTIVSAITQCATKRSKSCIGFQWKYI